MPLVCLTVPGRHRPALLEELRKIINAQEAEVVKETGEHGDVGLRFDDALREREGVTAAFRLLPGA